MVTFRASLQEIRIFYDAKPPPRLPKRRKRIGKIAEPRRGGALPEGDVPMRDRTRLAASLLAGLLLFGPGPAALAETQAGEVKAAAQDNAFNAWLQTLLQKIRADPKYHRLPLDTPAQTDQFQVKLHEAYRGVITSREFAAWAGKTYPGHDHEIGVITSALPK